MRDVVLKLQVLAAFSATTFLVAPCIAEAQTPPQVRTIPFGKASPALDFSRWRRDDGFKDNNIWFVCRPPHCPTSEAIMYSTTVSESNVKAEKDIRDGSVDNENLSKLVEDINQYNKLNGDYRVVYLSMAVSDTKADSKKPVWIDKVTKNTLRDEISYSINRTYYAGDKAIVIHVSAGSLEKAKRNLDIAVSGARDSIPLPTVPAAVPPVKPASPTGAAAGP